VKHERATEETQERAALFALGSLSQHEARAFEEHLREGCPVCAADLRWQEEVVGALALAAAPAAPPAYMRDIVAARIEREGRPAAAPPPPAAPSARPFEAVQLPPPRPRSTILPWAVAAAVALAAGASYFSTRQAENQIQAERARIEEERSRAEQARARFETETSRTRAELEDLKTALGSPGVRFIALKGQKASAQIYWDTRRNRWLVAANLPPAPQGKVYQLWFLPPSPSAPIAAGLIPTDATGRGFTVVPVPSDLGKLSAAAITLEPAGGSGKPTMPIYAVGVAGL